MKVRKRQKKEFCKMEGDCRFAICPEEFEKVNPQATCSWSKREDKVCPFVFPNPDAPTWREK